MGKIYPFILLLVFFIFLIFSYSFYIHKNKDSGFQILSPLPGFLSLISNSQVSSLELWFPRKNNAKNNLISDIPRISGKSALVYDLTDDEVLYEKNSKARLPMASLTKIMTAVIAIENKKNDDRYIVSEKDLVGENSMGLSGGEILTLEDLLYGLILHSGNDASEVLASNYPGGRNEFIKSMNEKVRSLGLKNTNFTNPSGLEGDGNQYSTAYDLLVITRFALSSYPLFKKVVATPEKEISANQNHKYFYLYNETNLLTTYPGVAGVKTGYTPEAGFCLITYLNYEGREMIGILLGSENRRAEMRALLDYSLRLQGIPPPPFPAI